MEDHSKRTCSHRAPRESSGRGRSLTRRRRLQAQNNLLTGGRAEKVDLEADLRPGEHNGENQEPPTTRSFSEDHPVRGRQRLQGASLATNLGTKPQLAEEGQGAQDNPRPRTNRSSNEKFEIFLLPMSNKNSEVEPREMSREDPRKPDCAARMPTDSVCCY